MQDLLKSFAYIREHQGMDMIDLGKNPISQDSPAGKDVRYDPNFEALSQEIGKLGSPTAIDSLDLSVVVDLSSKILESESKHLQVASYLGFGLMKTRGIEGMAMGIHILKDLVENFWPTLFPPAKRMKGRRGIIHWWEEKTSDFLSEADAVTWKKEDREALIADITALDEFLGENMPDAPLLRPLINKIKSVVNEASAPSPEPVPSKEAEPSPAPLQQADSDPDSGPDKPAASPPEPAPAPSASPQPPPEPPSLDDNGGALLKQGLGILGRAATVLRKEAPFEAIPYRLNRIVAWMPITTLPGANGGKTMVEPPNKTMVSSIQLLSDDAKWEDLINACESKVRQYVFWLDLSRHVCDAMSQLGKSEVCEAIEAETALFVSRMPGIENLRFSNDLDFADEITREWLRKCREKGDDTPASSGSGADGLFQNISEVSSQAMDLMKKKKEAQALTLLSEKLRQSMSLREKFLWKISLCRILLSSKKIQIAASCIDDLMDDIETYKLDAWEPEMAVQAYSVILSGLRLQKNFGLADRIESVARRISVLDPATALNIV